MFISPTSESIQSLMQRNMDGPVTMLNLLKFRDIADYSASPDLAPDEDVSGEEAFETYMGHTASMAAEVGAQIVAVGTGGTFLIGPEDERWDRMMLVRYPSLAAFLEMTQSPDYHAIGGHRTAALADSRLLPLA